jgi:hypothetical protein
MAKFLSLWHLNLMAPWPADPVENAKVFEMLYAGMDEHLKAARIKEFGYFLDGTSGYLIGEGESIDAFRGALSFYPFIVGEPREIVPHEIGRAVMREVMKAKAEAMKK